MFQRIDDQEAVIAPVDAVNRAVGVGGRVALVGRQLVVRERRRTAPVPHRQHEIPLDGPCGRGGVGGMSPLEMRSVQLANI